MRCAERVMLAARAEGEKMWHMPLDDDYKDYLKSAFADLPNVGGRWGGAITAAMFLKEFADPTPWVHLDIAGTAWLDDAKPFLAKGPTGVPGAHAGPAGDGLAALTYPSKIETGMRLLRHPVEDCVGELRGSVRSAQVRRAHLACGQNRADGLFHFARGRGLIQMVEHHGRAQDRGQRIHHALPGDVRRGAVHRLEHRRKAPRAGRDWRWPPVPCCR